MSTSQKGFDAFEHESTNRYVQMTELEAMLASALISIADSFVTRSYSDAAKVTEALTRLSANTKIPCRKVTLELLAKLTKHADMENKLR